MLLGQMLHRKMLHGQLLHGHIWYWATLTQSRMVPQTLKGLYGTFPRVGWGKIKNSANSVQLAGAGTELGNNEHKQINQIKYAD